ncbi:hypothetical protein BLNAU_17086 [Blattamonas nauphoetae]|uniref:Uncharacterized protein n=1 Tax=Blattamonas nauphoetae TaxID=2049346 RepID=A0ABQ9X7U4_9EUKA|nr:hypothetical protein BLNAU_17086 [Blattamonas nauphoetae]
MSKFNAPLCTLALTSACLTTTDVKIAVNSLRSPILTSHSQTLLEAISLSTPNLILPPIVNLDTIGNVVTITLTVLLSQLLSILSPTIATIETQKVHIATCVLKNLTRPGQAPAAGRNMPSSTASLVGTRTEHVESQLCGDVVLDFNSSGSPLSYVSHTPPQPSDANEFIIKSEKKDEKKKTKKQVEAKKEEETDKGNAKQILTEEEQDTGKIKFKSYTKYLCTLIPLDVAVLVELYVVISEAGHLYGRGGWTT